MTVSMCVTRVVGLPVRPRRLALFLLSVIVLLASDETTTTTRRTRCTAFSVKSTTTTRTGSFLSGGADMGTRTVLLRQSLGDDSSQSGDNNDSPSSTATSEQWQGFNPFDPSSARLSSSTSTSTRKSTTNSQRIISLRQTQMQQLMSELLNAIGDDENGNRVASLLQEHRDLLLEPLEDDDAVLESDSIFNGHGMVTRAERYQIYRTTMEERIQKARSPNVRQVLQTLADFVLSHEEKEEVE